jgi:hypothetical protein
MALRTLAKFRNPDITSDLNHRMRNLVEKGVFFGGEVAPVANSLQVDVQPFAAMGSDGMVTLLEGQPERLTVASGTYQYVVLHAAYRANRQPDASLEVLTLATYAALSEYEKNERVILAKLDVPVGALEVQESKITYMESDRVDPQMRSPFRGRVASKAALPDYTYPPTGQTTGNRKNDIFFVDDEKLFYHWDTDTSTHQWREVISAAEAVALHNHKLNQDDGTVAPDLYNAMHVLAKHRTMLDAGTASVQKFGGDGADFGADNAFVDRSYPAARRFRHDAAVVNGTYVQLLGRFYVGKGSAGSAEQYFTFGRDACGQLLGTDNRPIGVLKVQDSTNSFQIDPSVDADNLGFYTNPHIWLDFSQTVDGSVTGPICVYGMLKGILGSLEPADESYDPVVLSPPAVSVPFSLSNLRGGIDVGVGTVQDAIESLTRNLPSFSGKVATVGPDTSTAQFKGSTSAALVDALAAVGDGGVVYVLPGTYQFAAAVTCPSVKIIGIGDVVFEQNAWRGAMLVSYLQNLTVQNIEFRDASTDVDGNGYRISVYVSQTLGVVDYKGPEVYNCRFTSLAVANTPTDHIVIVPEQSTTDYIRDTVISGCQFQDGVISLVNNYGYKIEDCTFANTGSGSGQCVVTQWEGATDPGGRNFVVRNRVSMPSGHSSSCFDFSVSADLSGTRASTLIVDGNTFDVGSSSAAVITVTGESASTYVDVVVANNEFVIDSPAIRAEKVHNLTITGNRYTGSPAGLAAHVCDGPGAQYVLFSQNIVEGFLGGIVPTYTSTLRCCGNTFSFTTNDATAIAAELSMGGAGAKVCDNTFLRIVSGGLLVDADLVNFNFAEGAEVCGNVFDYSSNGVAGSRFTPATSGVRFHHNFVKGGGKLEWALVHTQQIAADISDNWFDGCIQGICVTDGSDLAVRRNKFSGVGLPWSPGLLSSRQNFSFNEVDFTNHAGTLTGPQVVLGPDSVCEGNVMHGVATCAADADTVLIHGTNCIISNNVLQVEGASIGVQITGGGNCKSNTVTGVGKTSAYSIICGIATGWGEENAAGSMVIENNRIIDIGYVGCSYCYGISVNNVSTGGTRIVVRNNTIIGIERPSAASVFRIKAGIYMSGAASIACYNYVEGNLIRNAQIGVLGTSGNRNASVRHNTIFRCVRGIDSPSLDSEAVQNHIHLCAPWCADFSTSGSIVPSIGNSGGGLFINLSNSAFIHGNYCDSEAATSNVVDDTARSPAIFAGIGSSICGNYVVNAPISADGIICYSGIVANNSILALGHGMTSVMTTAAVRGIVVPGADCVVSGNRFSYASNASNPPRAIHVVGNSSILIGNNVRVADGVALYVDAACTSLMTVGNAWGGRTLTLLGSGVRGDPSSATYTTGNMNMLT